MFSPRGLSPALAPLSRRLWLTNDFVTSPYSPIAKYKLLYTLRQANSVLKLTTPGSAALRRPKILVWALPVSLADTQGITFVLISSGY